MAVRLCRALVLLLFVRDFYVPTAGRSAAVYSRMGGYPDMLSVPGGFCAVVGQALVQYYTSSLFVLWVNSTFLCVIGFLCYLLLQEIAPRGYNLLLVLFPVLGLVKCSYEPFLCLGWNGRTSPALALFFCFYPYPGDRRCSCFMVWQVWFLSMVWPVSWRRFTVWWWFS